MDLESKVMVIDEKGNQTIERVGTLEETAADHQTRISANERDINGNNKRYVCVATLLHQP